LLFYQAELAELEDAQREYDEVDRNAKDLASIECQRDWSEFGKHAGEEDGMVQKRDKEKMEVAMKIREKLEKYHRWTTACEICVTNRMDRCGASSPPTPPKQSNALNSTIKALRNWFFNNTPGGPVGDDPPPDFGEQVQRSSIIRTT
jgi:hypothetical protein